MIPAGVLSQGRESGPSALYAGGTASAVCNVPPGPDGDLLISFTVSQGGLAGDTNTIPAGWTSRQIEAEGTGDFRVATRVASSEPASYTFGSTGTPLLYLAVICRVAGTYDKSTSATGLPGALTNAVIPSLNPVAPGLLIVFANYRTATPGDETFNINNGPWTAIASYLSDALDGQFRLSYKEQPGVPTGSTTVSVTATVGGRKTGAHVMVTT